MLKWLKINCRTWIEVFDNPVFTVLFCHSPEKHLVPLRSYWNGHWGGRNNTQCFISIKCIYMHTSVLCPMTSVRVVYGNFESVLLQIPICPLDRAHNRSFHYRYYCPNNTVHSSPVRLFSWCSIVVLLVYYTNGGRVWITQNSLTINENGIKVVSIGTVQTMRLSFIVDCRQCDTMKNRVETLQSFKLNLNHLFDKLSINQNMGRLQLSNVWWNYHRSCY